MNQTAFDFSPIRRKRRGGYYVTTPLTAEQFGGALEAAQNQQAAIMAIFRVFPGGKIAPSRVHEMLRDWGRKWPIYSIRARITTLEQDGYLVKTDETVISPEGKPEHLWALAGQERAAA